MPSRVQIKRKTATKRNRSKAKGTAKRKHVTVRASGRANANYVAASRRKK